MRGQRTEMGKLDYNMALLPGPRIKRIRMIQVTKRPWRKEVKPVQKGMRGHPPLSKEANDPSAIGVVFEIARGATRDVPGRAQRGFGTDGDEIGHSRKDRKGSGTGETVTDIEIAWEAIKEAPRRGVRSVLEGMRTHPPDH